MCIRDRLFQWLKWLKIFIIVFDFSFFSFLFLVKVAARTASYITQTAYMKNTNQYGSRITIAQARKALGMVSRNYSDAEIAEIISLLHEAAEFTYERYQRGD